MTLAWPAGTAAFEGPGWLTVTHAEGIRTPFELPRLEVFGDEAELAGMARAAAALIPAGAVEFVELSTAAEHVDPEDRARKHALRVHGTKPIERERIWAALWPLGARRFRWLLPHWEWDVYRWGFLAGAAPRARIEKALDALWVEGQCDRIVSLEPDAAARELLRGQIELVAEVGPDDVDRLPRTIETAHVCARAGAEDARSLLARTAHRLIVTAREKPAPMEPLLEGQRAVLGPGDLATDGTVLVLEPRSGLVRWLRV